MTGTALFSLFVGLAIGYAGQRSRMCFVGGLRDYLLVRDTHLLRGVIAFALAAWLAFPLVDALSGEMTTLDSAFDTISSAAVIIGGFGVGFFSILANGCPFRQHVLAAQGIRSSWAYLLGFYLGAILFHSVTLPLVLRFL